MTIAEQKSHQVPANTIRKGDWITSDSGTPRKVVAVQPGPVLVLDCSQPWERRMICTPTELIRKLLYEYNIRVVN